MISLLLAINLPLGATGISTLSGVCGLPEGEWCGEAGLSDGTEVSPVQGTDPNQTATDKLLIFNRLHLRIRSTTW